MRHMRADALIVYKCRILILLVADHRRDFCDWDGHLGSLRPRVESGEIRNLCVTNLKLGLALLSVIFPRTVATLQTLMLRS
jgi:hypothetical protein